MKLRLQPYFVAILVVLALTLTTSAWAQWSSDPNQNLALSDIPDADQVQPKVVPLADNGFFVSWFNNNPNDPPPNGYDTYLQRLDLNGYEQFVHDGIQIAKLTNSSTEDYGLDIDTQGNALLAFLDTREGDNQQVTVTKVSPSGEQLWGANGIQLTSGDPQRPSAKGGGHQRRRSGGGLDRLRPDLFVHRAAEVRCQWKAAMGFDQRCRTTASF